MRCRQVQTAAAAELERFLSNFVPKLELHSRLVWVAERLTSCPPCGSDIAGRVLGVRWQSHWSLGELWDFLRPAVRKPPWIREVGERRDHPLAFPLVAASDVTDHVVSRQESGQVGALRWENFKLILCLKHTRAHAQTCTHTLKNSFLTYFNLIRLNSRSMT